MRARGGIHVCTGIDEQADDFKLVLAHGHVQRGGDAVRAKVWVCAKAQQLANDVDGVVEGRQGERRVARDDFHIDLWILLHKDPADLLHILPAHRLHNRLAHLVRHGPPRAPRVRLGKRPLLRARPPRRHALVVARPRERPAGSKVGRERTWRSASPCCCCCWWWWWW